MLIQKRHHAVRPSIHDIVPLEFAPRVAHQLAREIPLLLRFARDGKLRLADTVTCNALLEAKAISETLATQECGGQAVRVVIRP